MTTIQFPAEWALRSSILILSGALLLYSLRVKDPSIRLAAWTAMLCGSLAIPAITVAMPKVPLAIVRVATQPVEVPAVLHEATPAQEPTAFRQAVSSTRPFDWPRAALTIYVLIAGALLLRLGFGLAMSLRLLRSSRLTCHATEGIAIRESDRVASPVALGIVRPSILLPIDWREWDGARLEAVLAHERSHIRRRDPAVQLLSAIHRALLWHSPLSWLLHQRIVRVAEEASDDAAVAATRDRTSYAEMLLEFMQSGVRSATWHGVPMARYGTPAERIQRILDGTALSRGVTRWSIVAIFALGAPLAYLVAAAQATAPRTDSTSPIEAPALPAPVQATTQQPKPAAAPVNEAAQSPAAAAAPVQSIMLPPNDASSADGYLMHRGTTDQDITAFMTIGGIPLQEKSFEIRKRIRNFVLTRRHEKAYLIDDPETVHRALMLLDDATACRESVDAATPSADELKQALAGCKIGEEETCSIAASWPERWKADTHTPRECEGARRFIDRPSLPRPTSLTIYCQILSFPVTEAKADFALATETGIYDQIRRACDPDVHSSQRADVRALAGV